MMKINAQVLDSVEWWLDQLRRFLAIASKQRQSNADWFVDLADDGIRLNEIKRAKFQSAPLPLDANASEISTILQTSHRRNRPSFDIRIEPSVVLIRELAPIRLPPRQARAMAELDLLASTPIDPKQAHIVFIDDPKSGCAYHVVKTKTLAPVLEAIRAAGGTVRSIAITEGDQERSIDRPSLISIWAPTRREKFVLRAWVTACAIVFLSLAATYAHSQWRYWQAEAVLDEQIANAQVEAKRARTILQKRQTELEQTDRIRAEKKNAISTVRVLAELTRLLPDNAWATDLSLKNNELTLTGFAGSAADLIQPIDASPLFSAPEFASPVVKVPGQTGERFTITARIDRQ